MVNKLTDFMEQFPQKQLHELQLDIEELPKFKPKKAISLEENF
jgi:hypothetical protein